MAHTLTFNYDDPSSGYTVRKGSISGEYVHSPYTLQNGDELYFQTVKINNTINGTSYSSSDLENTTLEFTDVDINIVGASGPQIAIDGVPFVLKYTESTPQPTLTFKHFYDAGTIGSGTVKFRHYSQQEPTPPTPQGHQVTVTNDAGGNIYVEDISVYENDTVSTEGSNYGTLLGRVMADKTITFTVTKKYIHVVNTFSGVGAYSGGLTKVTEYSTGIYHTWFEVSGDGTITAKGYYCLTGDTLITLADGTKKRIDELTLQDKVLAIDTKTGKFVADEITYTDSTEHKTYTEYDKWTFSDGTIVKTVHRHRFYNVEKQAMVYMDEWNIGEHAVNQNGEYIALVSHENVKEEVKHYTIFTKHQNYFANGLLSGNRHTAELHLKR